MSVRYDGRSPMSGLPHRSIRVGWGLLSAVNLEVFWSDTAVGKICGRLPIPGGKGYLCISMSVFGTIRVQCCWSCV